VDETVFQAVAALAAKSDMGIRQAGFFDVAL
jgi:hypothetical protein